MTSPRQYDLIDICENRHGGNRESVEAFKSKSPNQRIRQRHAVLDFVKSCGYYGATTDEVAFHFSTTPNAVSGRMSELKRDGLLIETGRRRLTRTGNSAQVLVIGENL